MTTNYYFTAQDQAFTITVNGLVPLTRHYLYFERKLVTDTLCTPSGGSLGQALISDLNGSLTFTYYYNAGLPTAANSLQVVQTLSNSLVGVKEIVIVNTQVATLDESTLNASFSKARSTIRVDVAY